MRRCVFQKETVNSAERVREKNKWGEKMYHQHWTEGIQWGKQRSDKEKMIHKERELEKSRGAAGVGNR